MSSRLADLMPLAERTYTRLEAQDLLQRCLREDDPAPLRELINEILADPLPNLDLLRDLLADVHARWVQLRERRFDVRRQVVQAFQDGYGIDITPVAPPDELERYHLLDAENLVAYLSGSDFGLQSEDAAMLREVFAESLRFAAELASDLKVLEALVEYLRDWIEGFAGLAARGAEAFRAQETFWVL